MRGVVSARRPDKEIDSSTPHGEALQSQFAIRRTIVFHRDHREGESHLKFRKIDLVFPAILATLGFVPSNNGRSVAISRVIVN